MALSPWIPIEGVPHRVDAGVISESKFLEHIKGPLGSGGDRKAGSAVACDVQADCVLDRFPRDARVFVERATVKAKHGAMAVAMAGDFMAAIRNLAHERREFTSDPTQHEDRGTSAVLIEHIEQSRYARPNSRWHLVPFHIVDGPRGDFCVEVVFQVDAEGIDHD